MDCRKIQELLSDYIDCNLDPKTYQQVKGHLDTCPSCRQSLKELNSTIGILRSVEKKPLPPYYQVQLDSKLDEAVRARISIPLWVRFRWHIVFSVFILGIFAGTGILFVSQKPPKEKPIYTLKIGEMGILTFNLYSKENVKTIAFHVVLPEGIALASKPKDRTFKWEGELVKGENVISLYVKALKEGNWSVNAKLQSDGAILKKFEMPLSVTDKKG